MLTNPELQLQLEQNGFVKFPFLKAETVAKLKLLYGQFESEHLFTGRYHHSTFHIGNRNIAETVDTGIKEIIQKEISKFFFDYELFVANFMVKEPGNESEVPPHQDWTYVDEPKY